MGGQISLIDKDVMGEFAKTLDALHISEETLHGFFYEMELPEMDFVLRGKLAGEGVEIPEDFDDELLEAANFQQELTYGKRFIVLYRRDQYLLPEDYRREAWQPFHICWCDALREAKEKNLYEGR